MAQFAGSNVASMLSNMRADLARTGLRCPDATVRFWTSPKSKVLHNAPGCSKSASGVSDVAASAVLEGDLTFCRRKACQREDVFRYQPLPWADWLDSMQLLLSTYAVLEDCAAADDSGDRFRSMTRLCVLQSQLSSPRCVTHIDHADRRAVELDRIEACLAWLAPSDPFGFLESVFAGHQLNIGFGMDDKIKAWSPRMSKVLPRKGSTSSWYSRVPSEVAQTVRVLSAKLSEGCSVDVATVSAMEFAREYVATLGVHDMCMQENMPATCRFSGGDFAHPNDWALAEWSAEVLDCFETLIANAVKFAFRGTRPGKLQLVAMDDRLEDYESMRESWRSRDGALKTISLIAASRLAFPEFFVEESWMVVAIPAGSAKEFAKEAASGSTEVEMLPGGVRNVTPQLLQCALGLISGESYSPLGTPSKALDAARLVLRQR